MQHIFRGKGVTGRTIFRKFSTKHVRAQKKVPGNRAGQVRPVQPSFRAQTEKIANLSLYSNLELYQIRPKFTSTKTTQFLIFLKFFYTVSMFSHIFIILFCFISPANQRNSVAILYYEYYTQTISNIFCAQTGQIVSDNFKFFAGCEPCEEQPCGGD